MELDFWSRSQKPIVNRTPCNIRVVFFTDRVPLSLSWTWHHSRCKTSETQEACPWSLIMRRIYQTFACIWNSTEFTTNVDLKLLSGYSRTSQVNLWVSKLMNIVLLLFIFNIGIMCYYFWEILRNHLGTNEKRKMTSTAPNSVFKFKHDVVD